MSLERHLHWREMRSLAGKSKRGSDNCKASWKVRFAMHLWMRVGFTKASSTTPIDTMDYLHLQAMYAARCFRRVLVFTANSSTVMSCRLVLPRPNGCCCIE